MVSKTTVSYSEIFKLSLPIIAGSVIENISTLINTAFLGRVGAVSLGAAAVGGIFYLALVMIAFGFGIGTQIIVARRYGEKNLSEIGKTLHHASAFLFPLAICIFLLFEFKGDAFFKHFMKSDEVYAGVHGFMSYRIWGIFFAYANILFKAFYIGILRTWIIGVSSLIIAVVNIFFDYALIFGHFGFPEMGISGAGLASVIAEITGTVFFIVYTFSKKDISEFNITRLSKFSFELLRNIFKIASPVMAQFALSFGGWFVFFLLVEQMGEIPLAVSNLIRTVYMIVLLPLWGYASATSTLVSYKIGSGLTHEIGPMVRKIIILSFISVTSLVLIVDIFSHSYFRVFTNDTELIKNSFPVLYVVNLSSVLVSIGVILYNVVAGAGKTMITLITEFVVMSIYVAWAYFLVEYGKGSVAMVWTSEVWYGIAMGLMSGLYLKYGNWRKAKV